MGELRIPVREVVESRMPTLHPWLWEAGVKSSWLTGRYEDFRTNEIVFVYRRPDTEGKR